MTTDTEHVELVVVGAGPAGLCAAIEAARAGVEAVVVDENPRPGGQIYRQLPDSFTVEREAVLGRELHRGTVLLREFEATGCRVLTGTTVWGAFEERVLEVASADRLWRLEGRAVIVASGARDRPVPLPGWTLPGVITAGAAQTLLKGQRMLPGGRILMAGAGPLQLIVASQLIKAGAGIAAVVEAAPASAVLRHATALLAAWPLLADAIRYRWTVARARVPWLAPAVLVRVEGTDCVERAVVARADGDWRSVSGSERTFEVDTVCLGYGLVPSVELLRLFGCAVRYDEASDAWEPERTAEFETSIRGVFAVGDGAHVAGAAVAADEGRVAGIAAACRLGRLTGADAERRMLAPRRRLARLAAFGAAMTDVYRPRPGLYELAMPDTLVCRCEEVRLADLACALEGGACSLKQLKAWTRAGMGPCQGRMCDQASARLFARHTRVPLAYVDGWTSRPPLKPLPIETLVSEPVAEGTR